MKEHLGHVLMEYDSAINHRGDKAPQYDTFKCEKCNYMSLIYPEIRFQKDCFSSLHDYIEKWLMQILQSANHHSKKVRVSGSDIDMVLSILEKRHIEDYKDVKDVKEEYIVFTP
jgi:histone H3/H4